MPDRGLIRKMYAMAVRKPGMAIFTVSSVKTSPFQGKSVRARIQTIGRAKASITATVPTPSRRVLASTPGKRGSPSAAA